MNAWLRQIHGSNRLYLHRTRAEQLGLEDDDWVWVTSRHGRIKAQVRLMDGVNPDTCWTWNAIGKRAGAWNLAPDAPEATKSFLLNHLIDELLPEREGGYRYANADPVTGQAAWYDLRVRIERAPGRGRAERAAVRRRCGRPPVCRAPPASLEIRAWSSGTRRDDQPARDAPGPAARPGDRPRHLRRLPRLRGRCKEWNTGGHPAPLTDQDPYGARAARRLAEPGARLRGRRGPGRPHRAFPQVLPALRGCRLRHGVPDRGVVQARRGRHRPGRRGAVHRLRAVRLGLPLRRARAGCRSGRDEEVHAVHRSHLQRQPGRGGPGAGLRAGVPRGRPALRRPRRSGLGGLAPGRGARRASI